MSTAGASEKVSAMLVEIRWGDPAAPSYLRLTDFTSDVSFQSLVYTAEPRLEIKGLEISGIFDADKPVQFVFPLITGGVLDKATSGQRHSPIFISLWEKLFSTTGGQDQVLTFFRGKAIRTTRNYNGRKDFVLFEAFGVKQRLAIALGLIAGHQCQWPFGGRGCGAAVTQETGTMTAVTGTSATITGLGGHANRFWHRGFVERDGLRIEVRDWLSGTTFELMAEPPPDWIGQAVKVHEGCDKTIAVCRLKGKEEKFSGFGSAIPAYSPNFENLG